MSERHDIGEEELSAYLDGALDPARATAVEAALAADPALAQKLAGWRSRDAALRALFAPYATGGNADLPQKRRHARLRSTAIAYAAGIAIAFFAGGGGDYFLRANLDPPPAAADRASDAWLAQTAREVFLTYVREVRHPVEVGADEHDHLVGWLGNRIEKTFTAPELDGLGFALVGGRLLPVGGAPGAMLMYENAQGDRMTILIARNPGARDTAFQFSQGDGVNTMRWVDGPIAYAISAFFDRPALEAVSRAIYRHFQES
ncbi:anti-sigma factor family protein [Pelagibacterium limicola]|uniref:anti-sigma factor family protein n=1 Tax=Pelagibacterium limicola TaxID=2791022 RepID=UPI0018AFC27E|nr:anti-sigma factor [Pelagibacterium limicola]